MNDTPLSNLSLELAGPPSQEKLERAITLEHKPRSLLLYGSNRECSFSR
ncbi:arsenical resistance protein ArsH, partial [Acinetobacter baumannii]